MQIDQFWKSGSQYRIVVLGIALLTVVVMSTFNALLTVPAGSADALSRIVGIVDVQLAFFITLPSFLVFAGIWQLKPETKLGEWAVRSVIAALVVLNLLAWGIAVWLS
jgi:hypothetical protein